MFMSDVHQTFGLIYGFQLARPYEVNLLDLELR